MLFKAGQKFLLWCFVSVIIVCWLRVCATGLFKKSREKEAEDETMALQIANMIISDITTTTQQVRDLVRTRDVLCCFG